MPPQPSDELGRELGKTTKALQQLSNELQQNRQAMQRATRGGGGGGAAGGGRSAGGGGGGGIVGGGLRLAGRAGVAGLALAGAAGAAQVAGQGLAAGTGFGTGVDVAAGGAAIQRGAISALSSVPILGEISGAGRTERISGRAEDRVLQITEDIARFGGEVSDDVRDALVTEFSEQERRAEDERQEVRNQVNANIAESAEGTALGELLELIREAVNLLRTLPGVGSGQ